MNNDDKPPTSRCHRGFTLVEVMVVLVLISIIITFAVLSVDTGPEELRREGAKLASLLELASEEAVMNGREYRVILSRRGYSFEQLQAGKWLPIADQLLRARSLPPTMTLALSLEDEALPLPDESVPDQPPAPALLLLSSGEIPAFALTINSDNGDAVIIRNLEGRIEKSFLQNNSSPP